METENDQMALRLNKLNELRSEGKDPFSIERYDRTHHTKDILGNYDSLEGKEVSVAGRLVSFRAMGKASFGNLEDQSGRIQLYFRRDDVGESEYKTLKSLVDLGDFLGIKGFVFKTKTGEISIHVQEFQILGKALRPLPYGKSKGDEQWYGLTDVEQRYRQRYVDLAVNQDVREQFILRSKIVRAARDYFEGRGYLEVETPVLQPVAGGAAAKPFLTHHNALDLDLSLRISLELYLKRLIVGGFEKVFEISRVFRNEGISTRHNPEFTLLESYEAYANLEDIMALVEGLLRTVAQNVFGTTQIQNGDNVIDFGAPWKRLRMLDGIEQYAGIKPEEFESLESAKAAMTRVGLPTEKENTVGGIIEKVHERFVQPKLIQPTFIVDFPLETSPLAKKRQDNPKLVRRFELYVGRQEMANAFSEINDPIDQRERFDAQRKMRLEGDEEAHPYDADFLHALEYGMPPTGGLGIGIDRMIMILANLPSVRDVILFPQMKPEVKEEI